MNKLEEIKKEINHLKTDVHNAKFKLAVKKLDYKQEKEKELKLKSKFKYLLHITFIRNFIFKFSCLIIFSGLLITTTLENLNFLVISFLIGGFLMMFSNLTTSNYNEYPNSNRSDKIIMAISFIGTAIIYYFLFKNMIY